MRHVHVHGEEDFASRELPIRGIVHRVQLRLAESGNDPCAVIKRATQEFHYGIFIRSRWCGCVRTGRITQPGTKSEIRAGNVDHQLTEAHRFRVWTERILVSRHRCATALESWLSAAKCF